MAGVSTSRVLKSEGGEISRPGSPLPIMLHHHPLRFRDRCWASCPRLCLLPVSGKRLRKPRVRQQEAFVAIDASKFSTENLGIRQSEPHTESIPSQHQQKLVFCEILARRQFLDLAGRTISVDKQKASGFQNTTGSGNSVEFLTLLFHMHTIFFYQRDDLK